MRIGIFIIIVIILLGGLFYSFSPKPEIVKQGAVTPANMTPSSTPIPKTISLAIKNNALVGGNTVIMLTEGETVTFSVTADADTELHIHGYDKLVPLVADTPTEFTFDASLTGRFPIEMHGSEAEIAVLEVQPK